VKVTGVTCSLLDTGARNAARHEAQRTFCAVELHTDESLTGLAITAEDVRAYAKRLVDELLLGEDPRAVTALFQQMQDARARHSDPSAVAAISSLDIALWDLKAQFNREPLWKCLGGSRPHVPIHAGSMEHGSSPEALRARYGSMSHSFGCRSAQVQARSDASANRQCLEIVQSALGAGATLAIKAHYTWTAKDAIRQVRALEREFDLAWIEAPARGWDFLASKRVVDAVGAPLCVGSGFGSLEPLLPHFHHRSVNILKIGAESGGITCALQKADAAYGFELPILLEASIGSLNAHLAGVLPYCMSLEVLALPGDEEYVTSDVSLEGGWASAGDRAGNGLQLERPARARS
jgi:L-alanine-DL-glutamate epimerase-like enolase superfamily enzyme